jgi:hypothetical protein
MLSGNDPNGQGRQSEKRQSERMFRIFFALGIGSGIVILFGLSIYAYNQYFRKGSPAISPNEPTQTILTPSQVVDKPIKMIPTNTPAPEIEATLTLSGPNLDLTATAACDWFILIFPSTPCPSISLNDLEATATESCNQFMELFPGTPCP